MSSLMLFDAKLGLLFQFQYSKYNKLARLANDYYLEE
jgi:hypothetical protein